MNAIDRKSFGILVDELITTSLKCWFAQENIRSSDPVESSNAGKLAQRLNARRNLLIRAIDEKIGDSDISPTAKTY